jgi:hypothetical protein
VGVGVKKEEGRRKKGKKKRREERGAEERWIGSNRLAICVGSVLFRASDSTVGYDSTI